MLTWAKISTPRDIRLRHRFYRTPMQDTRTPPINYRYGIISVTNDSFFVFCNRRMLLLYISFTHNSDVIKHFYTYTQNHPPDIPSYDEIQPQPNVKSAFALACLPLFVVINLL